MSLTVAPVTDAKLAIPLSRLEWYLVVLVMYLASTARIPLLSTAYSSSILMSFARYLGYLVALGLVVSFYQSWIRGLFRVKAIALLVVLSVVSTIWSISPATTLFQGVVLAGMTALGIYIGARFAPDDIRSIVATVTVIIAVVSILAVVLVPGFGGVTEAGWRGVFVHKNLLGQAMACGALAWSVIAIDEPRIRLRALAMFLMCCGMIFLSNSITSAVVLILTLAAFPLVRLASKGSIRALALLLTVAVIVPALIGNSDWVIEPVLRETGRDSTLTGRTDVWSWAVGAICERPIWGYGYSAYWLNPDVARDVARHLYWPPPSAHNGYLDLFLSVGMVGFAIFMISLLSTAKHALAYLRMGKGTYSNIFAAVFILMFVSYNAAESITGVQAGFLWILYVAVSVSVALHTHDPVGSPPESQENIPFPYAPDYPGPKLSDLAP